MTDAFDVDGFSSAGVELAGAALAGGGALTKRSPFSVRLTVG